MNANEPNLRELLRLLVRDLGLLQKTDAACCGVSLTQCHALVEIGRLPGLSLDQLSETLGLDKSTMSRTINHLVDAQLVSREPNPENRRAVVLSLTPSGLGTFSGIEQRMDAYYQSVMKSIPETKREQVIESLGLLLEAVSKNRCCL